MQNVLVISIKPEYMDLILSGQKSIELRKCRPSISKDDVLIALYCTAPVKAIVGFCLLDDLIEDSPTTLWKNFSEFVGVDKGTFQDYYRSHNKAVGLRLENIYQLKHALPLDKIREEVPNFTPPQTYKYYKLDFLRPKFKRKLNGEYHRLQQLFMSRVRVID